MPTLTITDLFGPIQEGLLAVEARLREIAPDQHKFLAVATEGLLGAGGKRIRPAIALLTAGIFEADLERAVSLAAGVEMLHTATLVHDDVIDESVVRRGTPTLNAHWSPHTVILAGDYLFARAARLVAQTDSPLIVDLFAQTLMTIVEGEIKQHFSKGQSIALDAYYERIYAKTAVMFVLAAEAAGVLGRAAETILVALRRFGRQVGLAFQIVDDILDFVGSPEQLGKPVGSDLRQGLFTLPAIYYHKAYPDDPNMKALLNGRVEDEDIIAQVVTAVAESSAIDRAMHEARELVTKGRLALRALPDSVYLDTLTQLAQYIVDRRI
jgi:geranylgeranyl pyrophosphate synthase